jgi:alpha-methylacyl-CoA racemase
MSTPGPLNGVRIVEIEALGPAPFCGMLLADLGAEVTLVERAGSTAAFGSIFLRGKDRLSLDLKSRAGSEQLLALVADADGLLEGMRPGKMERLGLGPEECLRRNPRLVYGRMTGWGQDGPLAQSAGHDINYVSLAGAAWYAGAPGTSALPPPTLVGDIGGGALYLAVGMLAGVLHARTTGQGQVVDAAVIDGVAHMQTLLHSLTTVGQLPTQRGKGWIDGAPWYGTYRCLDGAQVSIGALEPQFFQELMQRMGLAERFPPSSQFDESVWPAMREALSQAFGAREAMHWSTLLEGTDACFAPVLSPQQAARHPHNLARGVFTTVDGVLQARAAPRFSLFPHTAAEPAKPAAEDSKC